MAEYTYTGEADDKRFVKADFERHDIDQGAVHFNKGNDFTAEMSDEAAEFLIAQGEPFVLTSEHKAAQEAKVAAANAEADEPADDADDQKASGSTAGSTAGSATTKASGRTTKASAAGSTSTT